MNITANTTGQAKARQTTTSSARPSIPNQQHFLVVPSDVADLQEWMRDDTIPTDKIGEALQLYLFWRRDGLSHSECEHQFILRYFPYTPE